MSAVKEPPGIELGALGQRFLPDKAKSSKDRNVGRRDIAAAIHRLKELNKQCGGTGAGGEEEEEVDFRTMSAFEQERYHVMKALKELRDNLIQLDGLTADSGSGASRRDAIALRNRIRTQVRDLGDARKEKLRQLAAREKRDDDAAKVLYHVNKTATVYRQRFSPQGATEAGAADDSNSLRPSRRGGAAGGGIPQHLAPGGQNLSSILEEDEFKSLMEDVKKRDQIIDDLQDELIAGVRGLRQKAVVLRDALETSEVLLTEMETRVEENTTKLQGLNKTLEKAILESNKSACCLYVICVILLLAVAGGIVYTVKTL